MEENKEKMENFELEENDDLDFVMNANDAVNSELVKEALERDPIPHVYTGL